MLEDLDGLLNHTVQIRCNDSQTLVAGEFIITNQRIYIMKTFITIDGSTGEGGGQIFCVLVYLFRL